MKLMSLVVGCFREPRRQSIINPGLARLLRPHYGPDPHGSVALAVAPQDGV